MGGTPVENYAFIIIIFRTPSLSDLSLKANHKIEKKASVHLVVDPRQTKKYETSLLGRNP